MPIAQGVSGWTALRALVQANLPGPTGPVAGGGTALILAARWWYFDGEIKPNEIPALGYALAGADDENPSGFIGQPGTRSNYRIHWWADSKLNARRLAEWYWELVHGSRLTLAGGTLGVWDCTARIAPGFADRERRAVQAIVDVTMDVVEA